MPEQNHLGSKQFYFVNKSQKSTHLSRSLPFEQAIVQRHVQTGRKRSRNAKRTKPTTESSSNCEAPRLSSIPKPYGQESETVSDILEVFQKTCANQKPEENAERGQPARVPVLGEKRPYNISLQPPGVLRKRDPFDATSVPMDNAVTGLLHYYMYYYHPSQWPNEMALLRHGEYIFHAAVLNILRHAVADKLTMCCLLSASSCRLQFVDHLPCSLVIGKESHYIHEALQLMASYLSTESVQHTTQIRQLLTCILFLNSAEAYRDNMVAAKTHLRAAVQLLASSRGGLDSLEDESLKGQLAMGDLFLGCVNLEPCLLDCTYDPGTASSLKLLPHELKAQCETMKAPSLLGRSSSFIVPELRTLISEVVESYAVKDQIVISSMSLTRVKQVTHWITLRNMAIRHKLLALRTTDLKNQTLRTAIIMWTLLAMNVTGRAKTVKIMAPRLQSILSGIQPLDWAMNEDAQLWITLVGFQCANEGGKASNWFMNRCRNLINCCLPSSFPVYSASGLSQQLEAFQRGFLFDEEVQSARTYLLAERLNDVVA